MFPAHSLSVPLSSQNGFLLRVRGNWEWHCLIHFVAILGILKKTRRASYVTSCRLIKSLMKKREWLRAAAGQWAELPAADPWFSVGLVKSPWPLVSLEVPDVGYAATGLMESLAFWSRAVCLSQQRRLVDAGVRPQRKSWPAWVFRAWLHLSSWVCQASFISVPRSPTGIIRELG